MMEFEIRDAASRVLANKQTCSDLEKVKECIMEALQLLMQHRDAEITGALEYITLRKAVDVQVCIHLQRAKQFITRVMQSGVQLNSALCMSIQEETEGLQDKPTVVTREAGVQQCSVIGIKEEIQVDETAATVTDEDAATVTDEDAATVSDEDAVTAKVEEVQLDAAAAAVVDEKSFHFGGADPHRTKLGPTQQNASSLSAGIKAEMLQEQESDLDAAPVLRSKMMASPPDSVSLFHLKRLSVRLVDCRGKAKTENIYDCKRSGKCFSEAGRPRKHHRITGEEAHLCQQPRKHLHIHTAEKRHPCQQPRKHHGVTGEEAHQCQDCGKRFSQANKLILHQRVHTGETPYGCGQCGQRFSLVANLHRHQLIHTGDRPHLCCQCGRRFTQAGDLRRHQRIHTGQKPFCCGQCGKSFSRAEHLRTHQRIHTGVKPYQCQLCSKSFSDGGYFRVHQRFHTGHKPFSCLQCGKRFFQAGGLRRHQLVHTRQKP